MEPVISDSYLSIDNLSDIIQEKIGESVQFVSYDSIDFFQTVLPKIHLEQVLSKHYDNDGLSPHLVNPVYLKLTEAEEKLLHENC